MSTKDFPSIRDIFNKFDLTDFTTAKYSKLEKQLSKKLGEIVPQFDKNDELDCLTTEMCVEAQAMGFEQGFRCAAKLLVNGGDSIM